MSKADIGMIGLGVMGQNLVLNMQSKGYTVAVYNHTPERTHKFIQKRVNDTYKIIPTYSLEEFVAHLKKPRKIMIMIKAGNPVDIMIENLTCFLDEGDIIIDGGNSFFKDTIRRGEYLKNKGILFMGVGISGGEEGALKGPSIMPGGPIKAWNIAGDILRDISAKVDDGTPCCSYIGEDGSGHFVKMVHNGIEYADMQLISEVYYIMRYLLGMQTEEIAQVFTEWAKGELNSYLIEITADILSKKDAETGKAMVDVILDCAGQKGTGKWTSQQALDMGVSAPTISEAIFARFISALKEDRVNAAKYLKGPKVLQQQDKSEMINNLQNSLYASKLCCYAQGFDILKQASLEYNWNLDLGSIALLWRQGCIIRAQFLDKIKSAYENNSKLNNLLMDKYFAQKINDYQMNWRNVVATALLNGMPIPALSSALTYYDSYRSCILPANIIQAQRDYFGAHTYERIDKPGIFHTDWLEK